MDPKYKNYVTAGLIVGALGLTYFMASFVVPKALVTFTKAAPATKVSIKDSYLLGQNILAKADGVDKCVVNVFVLDENSKGVAGKRVELTGGEAEITALSPITNTDGKASFAVVSKKEGQYKLSGTVEGMILPKTLSVTFRN